MPGLSLRIHLSKQCRHFCTSAGSRVYDPTNPCGTQAPGRVCRASCASSNCGWMLTGLGASRRCWGCKTEQDLEGLISDVEQEVGLSLLSKLSVSSVN